MPTENVKSNLKEPFIRSPLVVPKEFESFAQSFSEKNRNGFFLGESFQNRESIYRTEFANTFRMAKHIYNSAVETEKSESSFFTSSSKAINRTEQATKHFYRLVYKVLSHEQRNFPLAGRNKCFGVVAVPNSRLVLLAVSQDKDPAKDVVLRQELVTLLDKINALDKTWHYELASIPTKAQYLMPRMFSMRTPHSAPQELVEPPTRCVEVALMIALSKIGRFKKFTPNDFAIVPYSATLWSTPEGTEVAPFFIPMERNKKHVSQSPMEIKLDDNLSAWIDIWNPCSQHCKIFKNQMLAIAAAGGPATSFSGPRSERLCP